MDVDFYRYFIGREDQSVNEKVMISRIDQQIYVTKSMISMYELRMVESKKLRKYMINYLAIMMTVSSILCIRSKVNENLKKKERAVGISEEKRLSDICEDPIWNSRSDHEPSGKIRKKSFFYGIQCGEKTDRI